MSSKKHVFHKTKVSEIGNPRRRTKVKPDDKNKRGGGGVEEALRSLSHGSGCYERTSYKT